MKKKSKLKRLKWLIGRIPVAPPTICHKAKKGKGSYRRKPKHKSREI